MTAKTIGSFNQQHKELLQVSDEISSLLTNESLPEKSGIVFKLLTKLKFNLKAHLSMEDKALYPIILKSDDKNSRSIAQNYTDEMGGIAKNFAEFIERWDSEYKISTNVEPFISETKSLLEALTQRIEKEDKKLYPLFEKEAKYSVTNRRYKWLASGFSFGFLFIIAGVSLIAIKTGGSLGFHFYNSYPLLWVISLAPFVLGAAFFAIGIKSEKQQRAHNNLNKARDDMNIKQTEMLNMELKMATGQIQDYATQLETISDNIKTPICLIDKNYRIEQGFNGAFKDVFGNKDFFNVSILDSIFHEQDPALKEELIDFLELAFNNSTASETMLNAANPVSEWKYLYNEGGAITEKIITTKIIRLTGKDSSVEKLMIIFDDITFEKELQAENEKEKQEFETELELITVIFQNDKKVIVSFINELTDKIKTIKSLIEKLNQDEPNSETINLLIRHIHTVKGETVSIGFKQFAELSGEFESALKAIEKKEITIDENIMLLGYLEKLTVLYNELNEISKKLFNFSEETKEIHINTIQVSRENFNLFKNHFDEIINDFRNNNLNLASLIEYQKNMDQLDWRDLAVFQKELNLINEKTALAKNKQSEVNFIYEMNFFPSDKYAFLKEGLLHLIRNSIAHGIETPEERAALKKPETGKINIHLYQEDDTYIVMYSDDGSGLDIEKIKQNAIEKQIVSAEEIEKMENNKILSLIFKDGLSTSKQTDDVSGVGAGMSIVKSNVNDFLKGKLSLVNKKGNGIRIKMVFPV